MELFPSRLPLQRVQKSAGRVAHTVGLPGLPGFLSLVNTTILPPPLEPPGRVYVMRLAEDVQKFAGACERLLATAATSNRTLTEDEARLIQFYCKEVAEKLFPPSVPSQCDS